MTEQEKRENDIDEIFEVITDWANKALVRSYAGASVLNTHNALELSKKISTLFSRKEEEVRKKTAKEIYKAVLDLRELMVNNDDSLCILRNVESWAKEDGVEVEE